MNRTLTARDLMAFDNTALPIEGCNRLEIAVALNEYESAGIRPAQWPERVLLDIEKTAADWLARNPSRVPVAVTYGIEQQDGARDVCVMIVHHKLKAPPADAQQPTQRSAGEGAPAAAGSPGLPPAQPLPEQCRVGGCGD